jgi:hypothetical protein
MADIKKLACCTICDEPIFEITQRWVEGPYKGEVKQVGQPLPGARRVTIVRISGNQSYWSLCSECEIEPAMMAQLNKKEVRAMVKERSIAQHTAEQSEQNEKMLKLFEFDIPLGVLGETPWSEVS